MDWTVNDLKQKLETDISDKNARKSILKIFANIIEKTHHLNPSNWNISFRKGGTGIRFQLNFGHRYVLGVYADSILVMNKRETFLKLPRDFISEILKKCEFVNDGTNKTPKPTTVEELENYPPEELWHNSIQFKIPFSKCEEYLETLEPAICDFAKWCTENRKLNPQSEDAHVSAFIDYLNQELETSIPQPEYEGEKNTVKYYKLGLKWGGKNKTFLPLIKKYELSIGAKIETTPNDISICSEGFRIVAIMKTIENLKEIKDSRIINDFPEYGILPKDNKIYAAKCFIYELNQNQQFDVKIQQGTCELHDDTIIEKINELLPEFYEAFDKWYNSQGDTQMTDYEKKLDEIKNNLSVNRNVILTGAPGTGKTFMAKTVAARIILEKEINDFDKDLTEEEKKQVESQTDFVQFHPSYDYTDFVEGLRPKQVDGSDQIGFERKDGVFKAFCEKALKNLVDSRKSKEELAIEKNIIKAINDFLSISTGKDNLYYSAYVQKDFYIDDIENEKFKVYYSDGKLIGDIELKDLEIILHNIEKIKKETRIIETVGEILNRQKYHKMNSYIWVLCEKIDELITDKNEKFESIPLKSFVFIIDEINRGEVAKIFGELFYCIDPGYRGEKGLISTQYQNLVTSGEFQKGFFIPENVYIIGTMNDIDRSVESMDFAFRRRFSWIEVKASDTVDMLDPKHDDNGELISGLETDLADEAKRRMKNLNAEISKIDELNDAYHIGASYFLKLINYDGIQEKRFESLWDYHLKGILQEYLRGNPNAKEELDKLEAAYDMEEMKDGE